MQVRKSFLILALAIPERFVGDLKVSVLLALLVVMVATDRAQTAAPTPDRQAEAQAPGTNADVKSAIDTKGPGEATSARPSSTPHRADGSRFGLAFKTSTLGLGGDLALRIVRPINLRVGFGTFRYTADLRHDGTAYRGSLHLRSVQTVVDWFPFAASFHVSPGVVFHNGNRITAIATPPPGQVQTAGNLAYISDPQNPLTGKAQAKVGSAAPMLLVGFGNLVPRRHHFSYSVDLGVVYQGHPKSNFTLQGGACDSSGTFCGNVSDDVGAQATVRSAQHELEKSVSFMRFYPVASIEFGYRF